MLLLQTSPVNLQEFFTPGSFATLAGATGIVYIVCGVVQNVFNFSPKWFALALSVLVSVIGAFAVPEPKAAAGAHAISTGLKLLIALLNGFLIYASATGTNQLFNGRTPPPAVGSTAQRMTPLTKRTFRTDWWS